MELLITRSNRPHFYRIDQGEIIELLFENFGVHELGQPTLTHKKALPLGNHVADFKVPLLQLLG